MTTDERRQRQEKRKRWAKVSGMAGPGFLDGGNPSTWFGETGDQFDLVLRITAKPFHHGRSRAFDPISLVD